MMSNSPEQHIWVPTVMTVYYFITVKNILTIMKYTHSQNQCGLLYHWNAARKPKHCSLSDCDSRESVLKMAVWSCQRSWPFHSPQHSSPECLKCYPILLRGKEPQPRWSHFRLHNPPFHLSRGFRAAFHTTMHWLALKIFLLLLRAAVFFDQSQQFEISLWHFCGVYEKKTNNINRP